MADRIRSRPLRTLLLALAAAMVAALLWAPPAGAVQGWRWPVAGPVLTQYRNGDDPYAGGQHRGIDIGAPASARVVAAAGGTVTLAGVAGDSGLTIGVRTADGRYDTSYLHLGSLAVRRGDVVAAGDSLGTVGTTGGRSVAQPHLHFGVRDAGDRHGYRDPLALLPPPAAEPPPESRPVPVPVAQPLAPRALPGAVAEALAQTAAVEVTAPLAPRALPVAVAAPSLSPPAALGGPPRAAASARPGPAAAAPPHSPSPAGPLARRLAQHAPQRGDRSRAADARPASHGRRAGAPIQPTAGPRSEPHPVRATAPKLSIRPAEPPPARRGLDLGWLAAYAGLVAAALLLGRPRGPSAGFRRASSIAAWATTSPRRSTTSTRSRT
jgi:hypothetical protein